MHRQAFFEVMESRCVLTALWISSSPVLENAAGGFWLGRSGDVTGALDVHVQVSNGTATAGTDFTALDETIHLDAEQTQVWVEVEHLDDAVAETTESYAISASTDGGLTASGQGWIVDNDGSGSGSSSASGSLWIAGGSYAENGAAGFWVGRNGDTSSSLDVNVALTGDTATAGSDFTALSSSLHFNAGQLQVWVEVQHIDDATAELTERYTIAASASDGRTASGEGWIVDNDGSGSGSGSGSSSGIAPAILNFSCTLNYGVLTVTGSVVDNTDPTGYWVYFGDLLDNRSVQVLANDTFLLVISDWTQHGDISAWTIDGTNLTSQVVWDVV